MRVTHANQSTDLALLLRRLGGVLSSACGILVTLHLYTLIHRFLYLFIEALTQQNTIHVGHVVFVCCQNMEAEQVPC